MDIQDQGKVYLMNLNQVVRHFSATLIKCSLGFVLVVVPAVNVYAINRPAVENEETSVLNPNSVSPVPNCPYAFADSFAGTDSGTAAPTASSAGYGSNNYPGYFGPQLQLQFNNYGGVTAATQSTPAMTSPSQYTTPVTCAGHYLVTFTLDIRANGGPGCNYGENSMSVWSTTTDPQNPNAYGCPVSYIDTLGNPNHTPSVYTGRVNSCATFTNWVQCVWGNNFNNGQESGMGNFLYYGVQAFPIFAYTPMWSYQYQSQMSNFPYPGICSSNNPAQCGELPSGSWPVNTYQTAYCTSKPYTFKNVVYLNAGAQISAPTLATQMPFTPYNIAQGNMQQCGFSVVGGKFKVTYLGP